MVTKPVFYRLLGTAVLVLVGLLFTASYITSRQSHEAKEDNSEVNRRVHSAAKEGQMYPSHHQRQLKQASKSSYPEQLGTPPVDSIAKGYIILESLTNNDDGYSAVLLELLNFQCWATINKLELVEPSIDAHDGTVKTDLLQYYQQQGQQILVSLEKAYHMDKWEDVFKNTATTMNKMVGMNEAATKIHHWSTSSIIVVDVEQSHGSTTNSVDQTKGCMHDSMNYHSKLLKEQGLAITHELCFSSEESTTQILTDLSELIATEHENVVIIVRQWPKRSQKELISLSKLLQCGIVGHEKLIKSSSNDSNKLQQQATKYIKSQFDNESYTAIVLTPDTLNSKSFSNCLEQTLMKFHSLRTNNSKTKAFIAVHEPRENYITRLIPFKMFFRSIYWMSYSIDRWKKDINQYVINDKNLKERMSLVQAVASRASCLLLAGQGEFSDQIRKSYLDHQTKKEGLAYSCLFTITECNGN